MGEYSYWGEKQPTSVATVSLLQWNGKKLFFRFLVRCRIPLGEQLLHREERVFPWHKTFLKGSFKKVSVVSLTSSSYSYFLNQFVFHLRPIKRPHSYCKSYPCRVKRKNWLFAKVLTGKEKFKQACTLSFKFRFLKLDFSHVDFLIRPLLLLVDHRHETSQVRGWVILGWGTHSNCCTWFDK